MDAVAPRLTDKLTEKMLISGTHSGIPRHGRDALREPGDGLRERGHYPGMVQPTNLYTRAVMHPVLTGAMIAAAGLSAAAWRASRR